MQMHGFLLVIQLLAAAHALQQTGAKGTGPACPAASPEAFLACLENPGATDILIEQDLYVGDILSKYAGADAAPLQLDRYARNSTTAATDCTAVATSAAAAPACTA
jgi:hypothetical protein